MSTYLISDTHFDDPCILKKSPRSFTKTTEMNQFIEERWNSTIDKSDNVLFGGDLAHSKISEQAYYDWVYNRLNGDIIILRGNHEPYQRSELDGSGLPIEETVEFSYNQFDFYCSHKFSGIPANFDGWRIHGHQHHKHPFLDAEAQRVNISVDVIDYRPISIGELVKYIQEGESLETRPKA